MFVRKWTDGPALGGPELGPTEPVQILLNLNRWRKQPITVSIWLCSTDLRTCSNWTNFYFGGFSYKNDFHENNQLVSSEKFYFFNRFRFLYKTGR